MADIEAAQHAYLTTATGEAAEQGYTESFNTIEPLLKPVFRLTEDHSANPAKFTWEQTPDGGGEFRSYHDIDSEHCNEHEDEGGDDDKDDLGISAGIAEQNDDEGFQVANMQNHFYCCLIQRVIFYKFHLGATDECKWYQGVVLSWNAQRSAYKVIFLADSEVWFLNLHPDLFTTQYNAGPGSWAIAQAPVL